MALTVESVNLKPGVLFRQTPSGGVLMDIAADHFLALRPLSAAIWNCLASGQNRAELIDQITRSTGVCADRAEVLLRSQLECWERAELINFSQPVELPQPKASLRVPLAELPTDAFLSEPLVPWLAVSLFTTKLKYRRAIAKRGLARTLVSFQRESGPVAKEHDKVIRRTVKNYHAVRRVFTQGDEARDCLFRSLALAAVLRRQGVRADLCIGIVDLPFSSHAWVEADGHLLNETLRKCKRYTIIGRF